jgi:GMP synthase (glutamine-hydrolysing)
MTVAVIDFGAKYTHNPVAVIDFGAQYTQLIARRIREQNVYSEIFPPNVKAKELEHAKAVILSGSRSGVYETEAPQLDPDILNLGVPVLGICYGLQAIVHNAGGRIIRGTGEYGTADIYAEKNSPLLDDLKETQIWMSHADEIVSLPDTFEVIARSSNNVIAAVKHKEKPIYGVQFHPEVIHSLIGKDIFRNFLFKIVNCEKDWISKYIIEDAIKSIKEQVGDGEVVTAISGGVDSAVVGTLLHKAIGNQSKCIFIENGLLRKNEGDKIMDALKSLGLHVERHYFAHNFWSALRGVTDPEVKRKIIGREFIRCFEKVAGDAKFLAQGTLYPDVIESGTSTAATIKSHHNVGGLPDDMDFTLIEPVRNLFKDEVRLLGKELGLPDTVLNRKPFPGPGLAVRILGEVTHERLQILREADEIFLNILEKTKEWEEIWQAFAVLIPNKTVGVMGDARTYENIIALRAVSSEDGMTADWCDLSYEILSECSTKIINNVNGVNRVVCDITSKPPGTIEWE